MDIQIFRDKYIEIETKTLIRKDKNKKLDTLFKEYKEYDTSFNINEIISFTTELLDKEITIRQPLFNDILYPVIEVEVERNNIKAIILLTKLDQPLYSYQNFKNNFKYTKREIVLKGLKIEPGNTELLNIFEEITRDYIIHTLHEMPLGVLYGMNGASIEECGELLTLVDEYEAVCKKLNIDQTELINESKFYYSVYRDYLSIFKNYDNFADYLNKEKKNGI